MKIPGNRQMTRDECRFHWRRLVVWFQWFVIDLVWLIALAAVVVFVLWVTSNTAETSWSSEGLKVALAIGAVIGFLFKYSRDCERECLEIFERYNKKFAELGITEEKLLGDDQLAEKYLDLCSEEYLLYLQGRIHPAIWRSWATGMLGYLQIGSIKELLGDGKRYYGLTVERLR